LKFIADFHIHSKYSRATSRDMDLDHISQWAKWKGIGLVGTGDFTHPAWFSELKSKLKIQDNGLYGFNGVSFILTAEISCIYKHKGKTRKIHLLVFAPSLEIVEKINMILGERFNICSDGRPILGISAKELAKIILDVSSDCLIVPAHAWTPWFSVFGSKSGYDSIEECFEEYTKYIRAIETGLSSNPSMNWRCSSLDEITLISCSDAHSPSKLGREACVFESEMSYKDVMLALCDKGSKKLAYTLEFFPEEGKYHYDGHSNCNVSWSPLDTKLRQGICSICSRPVTVGVMSRLENLADRPAGYLPKKAVLYKSIIPLQEIISEVLCRGVNTKSAAKEYFNLIEKIGSEFHILLEASQEQIESVASPRIAEAIIRMRQGKVFIQPGYDGVFGKIKIFSENTNVDQNQMDLFEGGR
jgi:uncharacterized protein (TIGR00375 family)